jgi:hypothetical protein
MLWINMVDMLTFLKKNGIKNKIAIGYKVKNLVTGAHEILTDVIPPHYQEITEVIYTDIPDVAGEKDYEAFILSIRLILDFK